MWTQTCNISVFTLRMKTWNFSHKNIVMVRKDVKKHKINLRETNEEGGCWGNGFRVIMKMNEQVVPSSESSCVFLSLCVLAKTCDRIYQSMRYNLRSSCWYIKTRSDAVCLLICCYYFQHISLRYYPLYSLFVMLLSISISLLL